MEKVIVANQKMSLDAKETNKFLKHIVNKNLKKSVIICPSYVYLPYYLGHSFSVGVQNISGEIDHKNTGEISALQVKSMGVKYTLLGHSERKIKYKEKSHDINKKIKVAIKNNLLPIVCIGEMEKVEDAKNEIKKQLSSIFKGIKGKFVIAYEPVWAIGAKTMPNKDIEKNIAFIKDIIKKNFDFNVPVIYGGNVNVSNIERLNHISNVDGFLVGDASINADELLKIIEVVCKK